MNKNGSSARLDEILVAEGLVTEEQIREALQLQKEEGGRIGSHLMRHGHIDEQGLVTALSKQSGCDGVVLTDLEIPELIIKFIPVRIATARKVLPFDYNPETNVLCVACEDPNDPTLIEELDFVARGKKVRLYVAAELALKSAIARYYVLENEKKPQPRPTTVSPPENGFNGYANGNTDREEPGEDSIGTVLLVTDEEDRGAEIRTALEKERYSVVTIDSADDAIDMIGDHQFDTVFIKDTVPGDYIDLIDRLRKCSPRTRVHYYESSAALLLDSESSAAHNELLMKNLDVFTTLLASRDKDAMNHSATVGQYADRLCRRIGLPDKDRMVVSTAAYLHDLARYYYDNVEIPEGPRDQVELTAKLLDSLNFSPLVVGVLRSMYINLRKKYTKRLPIEVLGGNIVTAADIFCDTIPPTEAISLDKFETIRTKFHDLTGKLFLPEIVEAFVGMVQDEMLSETPDARYGQVLIYASDQEKLEPIRKVLRKEGFRVIADTSFDSFVALYGRGKPDMMILLSPPQVHEVGDLVDALVQRGVRVAEVPTYLLTDPGRSSQLTSLLEKGIEDIVPFDDNLGLLVAKMKKARMRVEAQALQAGKAASMTGSLGSLENMNLIDLLQTLGPGRKTACISISSEHGELEVYLHRGDIIYARCGDKLGAEAVYEAIAWPQGTWSVQPVAEDDLPEPNNEYSNESILMEGCRRLDENSRSDTQRMEQVP